jgi:proteasome beta subunit
VIIDVERSNPPVKPLPESAVTNLFIEQRTSSFVELLASHAPSARIRRHDLPGSASGLIPHGTTIIAMTYQDGVVLAGDRRVTMGSMIAKRDVDKIFRADEFSGIGCAGAMGIILEFARLFQVELEHYEKLEGRTLSLEGKARRLGTIVGGNMAAAFQGLAAVPVFAGYDDEQAAGRIFSYDITGGCSEERGHYSVGSGSVHARGSLKKLYVAGCSEADAVRVTIQALYDAADEDSATGGPDLTRQIFPSLALITADGFSKLADEEVGPLVEAVVRERADAPDGPVAAIS